MKKPILAIGLMSGTSLDGIDVALVRTDGDTFFECVDSSYMPYPDDLRMALSIVARGDIPLNKLLRLEQRLTALHAEAVLALFNKESGIKSEDVEVIGFHGQTIRHLPDEGLTWQLGNVQDLAAKTGIKVVGDFRRMDMAYGGQGAPLVPLFHAAILASEPKPLAVINIGGVANMTVLNSDGSIVCGDTGPGVGLLDQWIQNRTSQNYDRQGEIAAAGEAHAHAVENAIMADPYFAKPFPKSADRYQFKIDLKGLSTADGAATLCLFTARAIAKSLKIVPEMPKRIFLSGGGSKHPVVRKFIEQATNVPCVSIDEAGLRPDTLEAEAFAWLAVRRLFGLPTTLCDTTGCRKESSGGVLTS